MLLTCIRSKLYWNEQTTDDIFAEIARQACELFIEGFQDPQLNFLIDTEVLYFWSIVKRKYPPIVSHYLLSKLPEVEPNGPILRFACIACKGDWVFARKASCHETCVKPLSVPQKILRFTTKSVLLLFLPWIDLRLST